MSLVFAAGANVVDFGNSAAIQSFAANAGTIIVWVFPTDISGNTSFVRKSAANYTFNAGATTLQMNIPRASTGLLARVTTPNFPLYVINTWVYVAATYDVAGIDTDQKLFFGNLTNQVAEVSTYTSQQVGSGLVTDTSGSNLTVGNGLSNTVPFLGNYALVACWNRRLSLNELIQQQFRPYPSSGCILFSHLGFGVGTGTQWDLSGSGNVGTVTGASVADHVPIASMIIDGSEELYKAIPSIITPPFTIQPQVIRQTWNI